MTMVEPSINDYWPAPAKLNLFLYINYQRADGYHQLQTLFQLIDYGDQLTFYPRTDQQFHLTTPLANVASADNLIIRAAQQLAQVYQQQQWPCYGVDIDLVKRLPMGGGLGGGSSNAATTLVALNAFWGERLTHHQLAQLATPLGADIPLFILGHSAFAEGIGEQLSAIELPSKWYLIVKPDVHIATANIFQSPDLPRNTPAQSLASWLSLPMRNDCQSVVTKQYPQVEQLLNWLLHYAPARLTGTGSCVFAEFSQRQAAQRLLTQLPANCQGFIAQGINQSPLLQRLARWQQYEKKVS